jgi:hypothetical protein
MEPDGGVLNEVGQRLLALSQLFQSAELCPSKVTDDTVF